MIELALELSSGNMKDALVLLNGAKKAPAQITKKSDQIEKVRLNRVACKAIKEQKTKSKVAHSYDFSNTKHTHQS